MRWFLLLIVGSLTLCGAVQQVLATERAIINGQVLFGDTPLCTMVLANGKNMFSCSGDGSYSLDVPLDANGQITLFTFAAGFAPFKRVMFPTEAAYFTVNMKREAEGRNLSVTRSTIPAARNGWAVITGSINYNGTPVCALMLANGQHMFSCNASLGQYRLEVPADINGNITLYAFVSGFQPYRVVFPAPQDAPSGCDDPPVVGRCQQVTLGHSDVQIVNNVSTGLLAYFPDFAFEAEMRPSVCEIFGLPSGSFRVELIQCNFNSDDDCIAFGLTKIVPFSLDPGECIEIDVTTLF